MYCKEISANENDDSSDSSEIVKKIRMPSEKKFISLRGKTLLEKIQTPCFIT